MSLFFALLLAAAQQREPFPPPDAAPSVIAAERAFASRAQSEGQWTAFRATAGPDAIMFAPDRVGAHQFLERFTSDPAVAVMWWPGRVWVSCDGTLAVTTGPWVRNGGTKVGSFTTVWRREPGEAWRWVYDNGRELPAAIEAPDQPAVEPIYCGGQPRRVDWSDRDPAPLVQFEGRAPNEGRDALPLIRESEPVAGGHSLDRSLEWSVVRLPALGAHAYTFRVFSRTRNHRRVALIEFSGLEQRPAP